MTSQKREPAMTSGERETAEILGMSVEELKLILDTYMEVLGKQARERSAARKTQMAQKVYPGGSHKYADRHTPGCATWCTCPR